MKSTSRTEKREKNKKKRQDYAGLKGFYILQSESVSGILNFSYMVITGKGSEQKYE